MQRSRIRLVALTPALVAVALIAGACSSGDSGGDGTSTETDSGSGDIVPGSANISIANLTFEPTTLTVASVETEITVTNADSVDHTFTLDDLSVDQPVASGESAVVAVDLPKSTGFHCEIHPSMTGTLKVA